MRSAVLVVAVFVGCTSGSEDTPRPSRNDCNNVFVRCPSGYIEAIDNECAESPELCTAGLEGECNISGECVCEDVCDGFLVEACTGHESCNEHDACGVVQPCATCTEEPTCGDREELRIEGCEDDTCREVACVSDPELTYHCHAADESCDTACPTQFRECTEPSDTCIETETCGQIRLCESVL